ncbi:hypothetical protein BCR44DRAFT_1439736 [Catenaria anguillulae PL171]|uniref:F-box domain-containing protein n=1 Tax=Catenaria anguillulae PL171 TaxID=765915 RepID=A0A1Y2HDS0_9FUNG|nr:hypothetical protein BCR44DRAFT_1439736 [Catenaria anguillulae PL171]
MLAQSPRGRCKLTFIGLPDDLLQTLTSCDYLTQIELVNLACTCKALAAAALPALYTNLHIESCTALPRLATTLHDRPDLARHVKSIRVGKTFVIQTQFAMLLPSMRQCQPYAQRSALAPSMSKVTQVCGQYVANQLPMPLLARIARLAPNLTTVDFSQVQSMGAETICLLVGFADLARILRDRRGRFLGNMETPISCILTNYPVECTNAGTRFGYAPQQVSVTNASNPSLVSIQEQPTWAIGDVYFHTGFQSDSPTPTSLSKGMEGYTGLKVGEDYVFDYASKPCIVQGKQVAVTASYAPAISSLLEAINVNVRQQCSHVVIDGPDPETLMLDPRHKMCQFHTFSVAMFSRIAQGPFANVSRLKTVDKIIQNIAAGFPNLVDLDLRSVACAMDRIMYHLDRLIRRTDKSPVFGGKPLKTLYVSTYVASFERLADIQRSPLQCAKATRGHGSRQLDCGPGHGYDRENTLPAQTHLRLKLVQLFILPPQHAKPNSPSFLPLSRIVHPGNWRKPTTTATATARPFATRTVIPSFSVYSHCLFLSTARDRFSATPRPTVVQPAPRTVHDLLPRCPRLKSFALSTNGPHIRHRFLTRDSIPALLSQFPELTLAQCIGFSKPTRNLTIIRQMRGTRADPIVAKLLAPYPRELSPCPKLRHVVVNDELLLDYHELPDLIQSVHCCQRHGGNAWLDEDAPDLDVD